MLVVAYRDWQFEVDKIATAKYYADTEKGWADDCNCGDCMLYAQQRDNCFPEEVITLFNELGIDYKKEPEVYTVDLNDTEMLCQGWFYFKGGILTGLQKQLVNISPAFSISFEKCGPVYFPSAYFAKNIELVQINFSFVMSR